MPDNEKGSKNTTIIRIILNILVMIIVLLGMFKIINPRITIPLSASMLAAVAVWNSISYIKSGRKKQSVFTFGIAAVLIIMLIFYFVKEYI